MVKKKEAMKNRTEKVSKDKGVEEECAGGIMCLITIILFPAVLVLKPLYNADLFMPVMLIKCVNII